MFTLALQRRFEARHHLIGGDWGAENDPHAHSYLLELRLEGEGLNKHGYLVDLVDVESRVEQLLARFGGADLNSLSEFAGLNPSLEHFARILGTAISKHFKETRLNALTVRLWESDSVWAEYRQDL
ncbi:MAG TPA: 6-carboxytetrahydropterin synthase [Anaerolineales bacterium]|nr:6-carboxytetrahydropterin synthase [Anaerolineales bacterium]